MALEYCMESFIKYKQHLDDIERNGMDDKAEESYEKLFMKLRDETANFKTEGICTMAEGEKKSNTSKNRYKDIVPYDHNRVLLNNAGSDYINASHIKGVTYNQRYIAAQGPMPETVGDFWNMLWDNDIKVIIMACNEFEGIPRKLRCQRYWAKDMDENLQLGDIVVKLLKEEEPKYEEYTVRHLKATRGSESRDIVHLHYTAWPDRGTPKSVQSILNLIETMRKIQPPDLPNAPPVVIHCSAGCGRTGTIIVVDYVCNLLKFGKLSPSFSLYDIILEMRQQRMAIVQSLEQYVFVHEAVVELFKKHLESQLYYNSPDMCPASPTDSTGAYEQVGMADPARLPKPAPRVRPTNLPSVKADSSIDSCAIQRPPKPPTPKPPQTPRKPSTDHSPIESVNTTAVYAIAGGRPPMILDVKRKNSASNSVSPVNDYAEVNISPDSNCSSKYPPTWNSGPYAEVEVNSRPVSTTVTADYEYADLDATNKWALQHIARGVDQNFTVDSAYAVISVRSDEQNVRSSSSSESDEDVPTVPPKPTIIADNGSVTSFNTASSNAPGALFSKFKQMIRPQPSVVPDVATGAYTPAKVTCYGLNISFPNRIDRPRYGPRELNCRFVEQSCRL